MIYAIEAAAANAVKIGFSRDPRARFRQIQVDNPLDLELIGVMPGTVEVERDLHRRFSGIWIRGEWFRDSPDLRAFIATMDAPPPRYRCETWPATRTGGHDARFSCQRCGGKFDRRSTPGRVPKFCTSDCANKRHQGASAGR